ncbi:hypothetical protein ACFY05_37455 [Microtetraspora fusca]|uniref:CHAT domain-containing protein n=1 Tax=Microtetraspora fusca TaxID=1997 RepID=A0ABW6VH32_MICFU
MPQPDAERWFGASILTMTDYLPGLRLAPELNDAIDHLEGQFVTRRRVLRDSEAEDIPELRDTEPDEPLPALLLTACSLEGHSYLDTFLGLASGFGIGALLVGRSASGTTCEVGEGHQVTEASGTLAEKLRDTTLFHLTQSHPAPGRTRSHRRSPPYASATPRPASPPLVWPSPPRRG